MHLLNQRPANQRLRRVDPTQTSQMPNDQNLQTVLAAAWHA